MFFHFIFLAVSVGPPARNFYTFYGTVSAACPNNSIVGFISSSPFFVNKSAIYQTSNYTWAMNIVWTANINQTGQYM
jgi:hypothetical protein